MRRREKVVNDEWECGEMGDCGRELFSKLWSVANWVGMLFCVLWGEM